MTTITKTMNICKIRNRSNGMYVHLSTTTQKYELKDDEEKACAFTDEMADLFLLKFSHKFEGVLIKEFT